MISYMYLQILAIIVRKESLNTLATSIRFFSCVHYDEFYEITIYCKKALSQWLHLHGLSPDIFHKDGKFVYLAYVE